MTSLPRTFVLSKDCLSKGRASNTWVLVCPSTLPITQLHVTQLPSTQLLIPQQKYKGGLIIHLSSILYLWLHLTTFPVFLACFLGQVGQNEKGSENGRRAVKVSGPGCELGSEEERGQRRSADSLPSLVIHVRIERAKDHKILGLESCLEVI